MDVRIPNGVVIAVIFLVVFATWAAVGGVAAYHITLWVHDPQVASGVKEAAAVATEARVNAVGTGIMVATIFSFIFLLIVPNASGD